MVRSSVPFQHAPTAVLAKPPPPSEVQKLLWAAANSSARLASDVAPALRAPSGYVTFENAQTLRNETWWSAKLDVSWECPCGGTATCVFWSFATFRGVRMLDKCYEAQVF